MSCTTHIRTLYELAEHCEFGDKRDEHIRDRLVVGIADKELSRQLQLKADLTLGHVIERVRQADEVMRHINLQANRPDTQLANVQAVRRKGGQYKKKTQWQEYMGQGVQPKEECGRCGKPQHSDERQCPALKSKCNKCQKKGHWERKCRTKAMREVTSEPPEQYFLGAVNRQNNQDTWTVGLPINNVTVIFKIDTGAEATVIDQRTFEKMSPKVELGSPDTCFVSPGGDLRCLGMFSCTTSYKGKKYSFRVYVIEGTSCLLGCKEAVKMGIVKRMDEVSGVFGSSGLLRTEPVKIALREDAQPYAVHAARRIPLPLVPLVKKELQRMENEGIIEMVTQPTEWCAAMVPVLKPNKREVHICADLRKLNKAVRREKYVMPTVEEILPKARWIKGVYITGCSQWILPDSSS